VTIDELRLGGELQQLAQERAPFVDGPAEDVGGV